MGHIKVFLGGVIPARDIPKLKDCGIVEVFGPDTPMKEIISRISASVPSTKL
jgi:methylmalonyl-CoA mutase C-terminal domain/subunit